MRDNQEIHETVRAWCKDTCKGYPHCSVQHLWPACDGYKQEYDGIEKEWSEE